MKKIITIRFFLTAASFLLFLYSATAQSNIRVINPGTSKPEWVQPYAPFRIAGNLYYVGTYDLASYLITTPKGHILINTGVAGSDTVIARNMKQLGFRLSDIRLLLTNQVHFDHVGALAAIQKQTHAKVYVNVADAQVLADGGFSDYLFGGKDLLFEPVKADRVLGDQDTIKWGGMQLTAFHHPGHTKGSTSYTFTVKDGTKSYKVLIANMPSVIVDSFEQVRATYPNIEADYAYTYEAMAKLNFDLWLAAHASQMDLQELRMNGKAYDPMIFGDKQKYLEELEKWKKGYEEKSSKVKGER